MTSLVATSSTASGAERRRFLVGGWGGTAPPALAQLLTPHRIVAPPLHRPLDALTPRSFAGWRSNVAEDAPPETLAENIYDQIVCRVYAKAGAPSVTAFIGYAAAQRGLTRMHLPHGCYPSAGYTVADLAPVSVPTAVGRPAPAVRFSARRGDELQQVLYWSRIGRAFAQSYAGQNWAVTQAALHGIVPDGVLFRLSCQDDATNTALSVLEHFARDLVKSSPSSLRRVLLG